MKKKLIVLGILAAVGSAAAAFYFFAGDFVLLH